MYLSYEDYQNMGGTLDETAFNNIEFEAECIVNWYTFDRLKNETTYPDELGKCMYALIKLIIQKSASLYGQGGADGGVAFAVAGTYTSQSNDGVSTSYNVLSASDMLKSSEKEMGNTIKMYLNGVVNSLGRKLLYRGLYPGE